MARYELTDFEWKAIRQGVRWRCADDRTKQCGNTASHDRYLDDVNYV